MTAHVQPVATASQADPSLSLYYLLDPEVLANPYPLFHRLRSEDPVHWDPFLHAWVVTRYADVVTVLYKFSADRTPTPEQLASMGLEALTPIARVMVKQMLFLDAPAHTRLRGLASYAFTPRRVAVLREHIQEITNRLLDAAGRAGDAHDPHRHRRPDPAAASRPVRAAARRPLADPLGRRGAPPLRAAESAHRSYGAR